MEGPGAILPPSSADSWLMPLLPIMEEFRGARLNREDMVQMALPPHLPVADDIPVLQEDVELGPPRQARRFVTQLEGHARAPRTVG